MQSFIDIETYSPLDLAAVGADAYSRSAELLLCCWAVDDGPVRQWQIGDDVEVLVDGLNGLWAAHELVAHNAPFERRLLNATVGFSSEPEDWLCTMAVALAHSLPASLDALCSFYGLDEDKAKSKEGKALIRLFCRPQPRTGLRVMPENRPDEWRRFIDYCRSDVIALREIYGRLPRVNM